MGLVSWTRPNDDEWWAVICICKKVNEMINLTFCNKEDGTDGRISLKAIQAEQSTIGYFFSYGDPAPIKYPVSGRFTEITDSYVKFEGDWLEDAKVWKFYFQAEIAQK